MIETHHSARLNRVLVGPVHRIADRLKTGADKPARATAQVSASGESLSMRTTDQASALQETSASLEQLSTMTERNADHARHVKDLAQEAEEIAVRTNRGMSELVGDVARAAGNTNELIFRISSRIGENGTLASETGESLSQVVSMSQKISRLAFPFHRKWRAASFQETLRRFFISGLQKHSR